MCQVRQIVQTHNSCGNSSSSQPETNATEAYSAFKNIGDFYVSELRTEGIDISTIYDNNNYIDEGDPTFKCTFCGACMWLNERVKRASVANAPVFSLCCSQGKIKLPSLQDPPTYLYHLFFDKFSPDSKKFLNSIRAYNSMFSFTSMGGKMKSHSGSGPYSFVISGQNYHRIGSLLPTDGCNPVYSQLYVYDTKNEIFNRISTVSDQPNDSKIDQVIVKNIMDLLNEVNPFVKEYRIAASLLQDDPGINVKIRLLNKTNQYDRRYHLPSSSEVAALIIGDYEQSCGGRDIIIEKQSGQLQRIHELHSGYIPLQYPLLFPFGDGGYESNIQHSNESGKRTLVKNTVTIREFIAFRIMRRTREVSLLLYSGRLFQQFVVDAYTMIEAQRLQFIRNNQSKLRVEMYKGLSEALLRGETNAISTGKRIVLPSSFTGSPRYLIKNYQDAMAICRWAGHPDIFITFTCNPTWPEITRACSEHNLTASDEPDTVCRTFELKVEELMRTLRDDKIFGNVVAELYTIEFQKRGLPHAHIILFLDKFSRIQTPEQIDQFISAEIPDKDEDPLLFELVQSFMVHGPCGFANPKSPCMQNNSCSKHFPKKFHGHTIVDKDGYPTYRRRNCGRTIQKKGVQLDNRFIVPYNPYLLKRFQAHLNVEKTNHSRSVKYLFKYLTKGDDRVIANFYATPDLSTDSVFDEIKQYCDYRYVSSCEAVWRIFGFDIHHRYPPVEKLGFHLPNHQQVLYNDNDNVQKVLDKATVHESMMLSWMQCNITDTEARSLTYGEFPQYYVFDRSKKLWRKRKKGFALGRLHHVPPNAGELYFLWILLTKISGATSFEDLRTVNHVIYPTFRSACYALGLLEDDREFIDAIREASIWASGQFLRRLFAQMLLSHSLSRPDLVWSETSAILSEDLLYVPHSNEMTSGLYLSDVDSRDRALKEIEIMLQQNGRSLHDFPELPLPSGDFDSDLSDFLILQHLNVNKKEMSLQAKSMTSTMTAEQKHIYHEILQASGTECNKFFFVYGYGGTGKTFLWNSLISTLYSMGEIVLSVASSGIASTLLPNGRTAHSMFAIPISITKDSTCNINQDSPTARLIRKARLIIWDEAPMVNRFCIEAVDRTLRDLLQICNPNSHLLPFGGKCMVMGGDFRQILPVIPKRLRADIVNASINRSHLWNYCTMFQLTRNMRLQSTTSHEMCETTKFAQWILEVGNGSLKQPHDGYAEIDIPPQFLLLDYDDPIAAIVDATYNGLQENYKDPNFFKTRAILSPTIEVVNKINNYISSLFPGGATEYLSCDSISLESYDHDSFDQLYTTEFLNSIECFGLPPHKLLLKVGMPIMLIRNIDQSIGLCNGTRLVISHLGKNVMQAKRLNGPNKDEEVFIHRLDMNPSETRWPFRFKRRQFPLIVSFAMTINKSQGQSLMNVGLYLPVSVFTHGQLYVALSRVKQLNGLKILIHDNNDQPQIRTANVVYQEVFNNL